MPRKPSSGQLSTQSHGLRMLAIAMVCWSLLGTEFEGYRGRRRIRHTFGALQVLNSVIWLANYRYLNWKSLCLEIDYNPSKLESSFFVHFSFKSSSTHLFLVFLCPLTRFTLSRPRFYTSILISAIEISMLLKWISIMINWETFISLSTWKKVSQRNQGL